MLSKKYFPGGKLDTKNQREKTQDLRRLRKMTQSPKPASPTRPYTGPFTAPTAPLGLILESEASGALLQRHFKDSALQWLRSRIFWFNLGGYRCPTKNRN